MSTFYRSQKVSYFDLKQEETCIWNDAFAGLLPSGYVWPVWSAIYSYSYMLLQVECSDGMEKGQGHRVL